jgi:hypothetical protein
MLLMGEKVGSTNVQRKAVKRTAAVPTQETTSGQQMVSTVMQLQRTIGNQATAQMLAMNPTQSTHASATIQRKGKGKKKGKSTKDFSDVDSTQYRISGSGESRKIELVRRTVDGDDKVIYEALGLVTGFGNDRRPVVEYYEDPVSLGNWFPGVTHINGMNVAPNSGINSAVDLQKSINDALGGATDASVSPDAIDVLYTYSAQRGGIASDIWDCLKGKVRMRDTATQKQEEIMLDAVNRKQRVTVSAHSRGTIKTDNAIRKVVKIITAMKMKEIKKAEWGRLMKKWKNSDTGIGLTGEDMARIELYHLAEQAAKDTMDLYIQLIYAGNAVVYPSSALKPTMYVGGLDFVSMTVGSYTKLISGAKSVGAFKGHGFSKNYSKTVASEIAKDIKKR